MEAELTRLYKQIVADPVRHANRRKICPGCTREISGSIGECAFCLFCFDERTTRAATLCWLAPLVEQARMADALSRRINGAERIAPQNTKPRGGLRPIASASGGKLLSFSPDAPTAVERGSGGMWFGVGIPLDIDV
jgi:hypothetical protein